MEGNYWDAAMRAISMLPIIGDMVGIGGKNAIKIGKSIRNGDNIGDIIKSVEKVVGKTGGNAAEKAEFNISTADTPTGSHRVFINLAPKAGKTNRNSQFPYYGGEK